MYLMGEEEIQAVRRVIESGQLFRYRGGEGGETDQFEAAWAAMVGVRHALAVANGTAALACGLVGLGVGPGDEVIVPGYTFMASAAAVLMAGAIPVVAEVDESLTIDPADVERKVTRHTKAIIPVYMNGLPADVAGVLAVAKRHNLSVLEDCCQADGGSFGGRRLGSWGDAGGFSFNHFKIMACGEGGVVVTDDQRVYERALIYHDSGCAFRGHAAELAEPLFIGINVRINEVLAAILRVQLGRLEGILAALRAEKRFLAGELAGETAFALSPVRDPDGDCATHLGLLFATAAEAKGFVGRLAELGVGSYSPIDSGMHVYSNWEPIMAQRGAHHPAMNPFALAGRTVEYSLDMCPRTLDFLARSVFVAMSPTRSRDELAEVARKIKKAAAGGP